MILHVLLAMVGGWSQRHRQQVATYSQAENRALKAQLGGRRLRLTDTDRHRLAALAHPLGRTRLQEVATVATPDTLLRWYRRLVAGKFDASKRRRPPGRPREVRGRHPTSAGALAAHGREPASRTRCWRGPPGFALERRAPQHPRIDLPGNELPIGG
jgi:hypothetical protein